ncbi:cadherin-like domain-containing protein [Vibrio sp. 1CM8B]|uniref:cadherin-like domain-containing protein n=1 Tax=Vibrio sp. 1CM8B TaxID=2929167 RepID=UPI0020BD86B0|nr:cadherin-like domain-containing protein [Vibrio sp. 1CM8B]MCK8083999.1 cadherin-like domain-containing protein [Vibrio sp. 1CM8B]
MLNRSLLSIILLTTLSGCNGGESNSGDSGAASGSNNGSVIYYVKDKMVQSRISQQSLYIDLSENMEASDGSATALMGVTPLSQNPECTVVSLDSHGFSITADSAKACDYQFSVGGGEVAQKTSLVNATRYSSTNDELSSATTRALVGNTTEQLIPIHSQTQVNRSEPINVRYELAKVGGELDTANFTLDSVTLPDQGTTGSSATFDSASNTITYTPGNSFVGVERINYSYLSNDLSSVAGGIIDIGVSVDLNSRPVADQYEHPSLVRVNTPTSIDLSSVISDPDGDVLQLIDVFGYNSTNIIQPGSTSNFDSNSFTFETSQFGDHYLSYTVTDKNGGYASSTIKVNVETDISVLQSWGDITITDPYISAPISFTAPMSLAYAELSKVPYHEVLTGDGINAPLGEQYITMTYNDAYQHCIDVGGRLPIEREMQTLFSVLGNVYSSHNWPASESFWLADKAAGNQAKTYSLVSDSGNVALIDEPSEGRLVTCVLLDSEAVKNFAVRDLVTSEQVGGTYILSATTYDPDGNIAPFQKANLKLENETKGDLSEDVVTSDTSGDFDVTYFDYSMENSVIRTSIYNEFGYAVVEPDTGELDVATPSNWSRMALTHQNNAQSALRPHTAAGLPIMFNQVQCTNLYSAEAYEGSEFIGEFIIESPTNTIVSGKYSFYVQQVRGDAPQASWGPNHTQPGAPNSTKVFSIVINVWDAKVEIFDGYGNSIAVYNTDLSGERKLWFESRDGNFSVYTRNGLIGWKPLTPVITLPMPWGNIDENSTYWVGFGGYNGNDTDGTNAVVSSARFSSFIKK